MSDEYGDVDAHANDEVRYEEHLDRIREFDREGAAERVAEKRTARLGKMVIYGEGSGTLLHLAEYGAAVSICGVPMARATFSYGLDEKSFTCPRCLDA